MIRPELVLSLYRGLLAAIDHEEANALVIHAIEDGLPLSTAAEALDEWKRHRKATVKEIR